MLFGLDGSKAKRADPFLPGKLAALLPDGAYRFETDPPEPTLATLAWILGAYRFERYKKRPSKAARLVPPEGVDAGEVSRIADAVAASRDLINTPAGDLGPDGIEAAARMLSERHGAAFTSIVGTISSSATFRMIHAVGRAPPRRLGSST